MESELEELLTFTSSERAWTAVGLRVRGRVPKFSNDFLYGHRHPTNSPSSAQARRPVLQESHSIARRSISYRQIHTVVVRGSSPVAPTIFSMFHRDLPK